ncbi:unnamed protein product [Caenorhabditis angaria]|uniref:non-specific protein-tyrosine kinase n=1 Tax=Caenorhabditis angaria TaxID=860376 RepID=A0A9P1IQ64_9PELO|nr:unnamed protein product [Caenorhabditis angaria]
MEASRKKKAENIRKMREEDLTLNKLLIAADLRDYESELRRKLKLRNAADLQYVEEVDLTSIGMSRPEQKRLRKEYEKMYPSGLFGKVRKALKRTESMDRRNGTQQANNREDEDHHVIPIERITLCKELGQGEFGAVWQASWKNSTGTDVTQVAVKCVGSDKLLASSTSFLQEAAIMTRMRHDHVVRLFGVVLDTKKIMLVSELATCGSLLECLHKPALRDSFPVHVLCDYAEQIAMGMSYLESQRLIHRDLAARNVLVFSPKLVKISDFGLSRSLGVGEDYYRSEFTPNLKLPIAWCAPECINFLKFTSKSDVWAYGVTIWEMFSYGEMPWKNKSGAQILELVDRKKELLLRPNACPEDMYDMLKETWTHQYQDRPTFAEIIEHFPERRAQSVRAIVDCRDAAADHLHFKRDDLIVVISRSPQQYPDGYYWYGSLRNGKLGLFRPSDTVAHLGSEPPCSNGSLENGFAGNGEKIEKKKSSKKDKAGEREKKKLTISEPVGDVRHTCHVGIDGTAFGLLQLDKKAMAPTSTSPSANSSRGSQQISPSLSHASSSTSANSSKVHLRENPARNGISIKETMSLRDVGPLSRDAINLRETVSPPQLRAPSQPPMYSQPRPTPRLTDRGSVTPTAPPLSNPNSLKQPLHGIGISISSAAVNDDTFDDCNNLSPSSFSTTSTTLTNLTRDPIPAPRGPIAAVYARGREIPTSPSKADSRLVDEIEHLNRDLTNYSISTICDYSEDRPLLESATSNKPSTSNFSSSQESKIRFMTEKEMEKIEGKSWKEHRKTDEILREERMKEIQKTNEKREEENEIEGGLFETIQKQQEGWTSAAQEAYKLLVECGTSLKQTSMSPPPSSAMSPRSIRSERSSTSPAPPRPVTPPLSTIQMRRPPSTHATLETIEQVEIEENSPKRVHIIETKLIDGPARGMSPVQDSRHIPAFTTPMSSTSSSTFPRKAPLPTPTTNSATTLNRPPPGRPPKTRNFPLIIDDEFDVRNMAYDNLNGFGAGSKVGPPVPPKPKVSFADDKTS